MATAASQHAILHYCVHRSLHGTISRTDTRAYTHTHAVSVNSVSPVTWRLGLFVSYGLKALLCLLLSLSLPTWSFSETLPFHQQTKGPHNVSTGLSFSPSPFAAVCLYRYVGMKLSCRKLCGHSGLQLLSYVCCYIEFLHVTALTSSPDMVA